MRQKLLLLLLAILAATLPASAYDFIVDELQYSFTSDGKAVTVSGGGVCQNLGNIAVYGVNIPNEVTYSNKTYPVIAIDAEAFKGKFLSSLSFGDNITEIGNEAFSGCRLRGMLEDNYTDFLNLNNIKKIGNSSFSNFKGTYRHYYSSVGWRDVECQIISIEFSKIEYIDDKAFYGVLAPRVDFNKGTNLSYLGTEAFSSSTINTINFSGDAIIKSIGVKAFYNTPWYDNIIGGAVYLGKYFYEYKGSMPNNTNFEIADGTLGILTNAFYDKPQLQSISIPNSVEYIGSAAFNGCTGLTSLALPSSLKTIESSTFSGCTGLTSISIPESVTNIGEYAFQDCTGLSSINIGKSVKSLGDGVFRGCTGLTSISVDESNPYYDSRSNCNAIIETSSNTLIQGCSKSTIPSSIKAIGNSAFYGFEGLSKITIPSSVTKIGESAFRSCVNLTSISIPNKVTSIGKYAFAGCTGLTNLTIPANVATVGNYAFNGCNGVKTLNYRAKALETPANLLGMSNVETVNFDGGATVVPANLLPNYPKLALVNVGKDVANIAEGAFDNCDALKTMNYDAANCASGELAIASLDTLTLGTNVKSIAANMFYNCKNVKKIVCKATTPPELGNSYVFPYGKYIGVPLNMGATYKDKWSKIAGSTYTRVLPLPIYDLNLESGLLVSGKPFVTTRAYSESKAECSETGYIIEDNSNSGNKIKIQPTYTSSNDQYVYFSHSKLSDYMLPGHSYQIRPYIVVNSVEYDGYYWADIEIPALQSAYQSNVGPSSIILTDDTAIPENINFTSATFTLNSKTYESYGNDIIVTGLKPNKWYSGNYSVAVNEGNVNSTSIEFRTPALTLNTQPVKMLTNTAARLEAYTNLSEEETSCGFLWKRYDAPESMLGNPVYCPVYEGTMTGTLKNLPEGVYYQYRAFYRDSEGKLYYGDDSWVAFYTGDATVEFEPVAHTYDNARVSGANAIIQGVALRGSKDITEQGFEYWVDGPAQSDALMAPSSINNVIATGERMTSTLTSLKGGSNYSFRAYVKTADGTTYGEVRTFRTPVTAMPGDVNGDQVISGADVTALYNVLLDGSEAAGDADVNGDGVVSGADVTALYNLLLGQ